MKDKVEKAVIDAEKAVKAAEKDHEALSKDASKPPSQCESVL